MPEGESTVMETVMGLVDGDLVAGDRAAANEVTAMLKTATIQAGMVAAKSAVSHAHATAVAHTAATAATMATTAMGRRRDHRTGRDGRRCGQRDYHFAQHDCPPFVARSAGVQPELRVE
jgi:type IV secretory pathway TrbL component